MFLYSPATLQKQSAITGEIKKKTRDPHCLVRRRLIELLLGVLAKILTILSFFSFGLLEDFLGGGFVHHRSQSEIASDP